MKKVVLLLFILFGYTFMYGQDLVRNMKWGMTMSQVKEKEKHLKLIESNSSALIYEVEVEGYSATISYWFHNNSLYQAVYFFKNVQNFNYKHFEDALTKRYGAKPEIESLSEFGNTIPARMHENGITEIQSEGDNDSYYIKYFNRKFVEDKVLSILFNGTNELRGIKMSSTQHSVKKEELNSIVKNSSISNLSLEIDKEWATAVYYFNNKGELYTKSITLDIPLANRTVFLFLRSYMKKNLSNFNGNKVGQYFVVGYKADLPNGSTLTIDTDERFTSILITERSEKIGSNSFDL